MKLKPTAHRMAFGALCLLGLEACTPQGQAPVVSSGPVVTSTPAKRSYLDAGPNPTRTGGPNYLQSDVSSAPRQTDFFGNSVFPQNP